MQKYSEAYPNAPLEYVVCEIRFPMAPAITQESVIVRLQKVFHEWLPLVEAQDSPLAGIPIPVEVSGSQGRTLRFLSRDRRISVAVSATRLVVETTKYEGYERFRSHVNLALVGIEEIEAAIPGLTRIGLRYVDEVRVPRPVAKPDDWDGYINPSLLCASSLTAEGKSADSLQGIVQFSLEESRKVVVRYGAQRGTAIGNAPLRRRSAETPKDDPYFLVDIDSFWTAKEPTPEFSVETALATCDRLHGVTRGLFEAVITERLRNEVLRRAPSDT